MFKVIGTIPRVQGQLETRETLSQKSFLHLARKMAKILCVSLHLLQLKLAFQEAQCWATLIFMHLVPYNN